MALDADLLRRNRLLAAAPRSVLDRLAGVGSREDLDFKQLLFEEGARIERVVFPIFGVCSLLTVTPEDRIVEVATIGNEGFVGLPVFLQATLMSAHRAIAQIPGEAVVLDAAEFLEISNSGGPFQAVLMRYTQALMTQIAQAAACNRLHNIEQRCARWLLMTHDRVEGDSFELTQEFLSQMLGSGRQAVNEAAQALQERGLISYTRGTVTVADRPGLEACSCECYGIIRDEFDRLLPDASA
jgi:CRP-like cAMP-binding protein